MDERCDNCDCTLEAGAMSQRWFDTETHEWHEGKLCAACIFDGVRGEDHALYLN